MLPLHNNATTLTRMILLLNLLVLIVMFIVKILVLFCTFSAVVDLVVKFGKKSIILVKLVMSKCDILVELNYQTEKRIPTFTGWILNTARIIERYFKLLTLILSI